jgi:hypothetical protein
VDFLVNELSLAGQFQDFATFHSAVGRLMGIRQEILRLGSSIYCHRNFAHARVTATAVMQQAIQGLPMAQRRAWMQWLTRQGPYWEDAQLHDANEWLEANAEMVTNTAIGEAAICRSRGLSRELISLDPSDWLFTPIVVTWMRNETIRDDISVKNHWDIRTVQESLAANPISIDSWGTLATHTQQACTRLTFASNAFDPLAGRPFSPGAAERIQVLLYTLDKFKGCFDEDGKRNAEGHKLYTEHFTGEKAWFSDSSDTEKNDFKNELTFSHPGVSGQTLFATWHGKVKTPQIRIHFSWPVRSDTPLYVLYVGPKITNR